jgi:hypothetical protein
MSMDYANPKPGNCPRCDALEADLYRLAEWETAQVLARGAPNSTGISFGLLQREVLARRALGSPRRINSTTFCQWWDEIGDWLAAEEARIWKAGA